MHIWPKGWPRSPDWTKFQMRKAVALLAEPRTAVVLTVILALIVAVATLTPSHSMPSAPGSDKLHHFLAFGAIAFPPAFARPRLFVWIVLAVSAYGAAIEIIQPHVGRHGDAMDAIANAVGAIFGASLGVGLRRFTERHHSDHE